MIINGVRVFPGVRDKEGGNEGRELKRQRTSESRLVVYETQADDVRSGLKEIRDNYGEQIRERGENFTMLLGQRGNTRPRELDIDFDRKLEKRNFYC